MKLGIDIIEIHRIEKLIDSKRFLSRIFTENEREYIEKKDSRLNRSVTAAGLFSAKEAVSKSFGTGISGFKWKDIEILHDKKGKPFVKLHGNAEKLLNNESIELTISHSRETAVAQSIIFENKDVIISKTQSPVIIPERKKDSHKGNYGKLAVIGGSTGMIGAPCLSSFAALKSGSGLVYTVVPKSIYEIAAIKSLENIVIPLEDNQRGHFTDSSISDFNESNTDSKKFDTVAIGPGMGRNEESLEFLRDILKLNLPTVVDADGLNLISVDREIMKFNDKLILTPHTAEFSRISGIDIAEIERDREFHARRFSEKYGVTLVLKGANTIVADKGSVYINKTGNPGMATAGSGDVLTGIISSFLGQGFGVFESAKLGVYIHGLAGDIAAYRLGEYSMTAGDIINSLPDAIKNSVKGE